MTLNLYNAIPSLILKVNAFFFKLQTFLDDLEIL